jgi:hypothetical protein
MFHILSFELVRNRYVDEPGKRWFAHLSSGLASALPTESSKNKLAFTNHSFTERAGPRLGHIVPVNIFYAAATVTNKMVMAHAFQIESAGAAFDGHFPYETCLHQIAKVVIGCCSRGAGIYAVYGFENFRGRRMALMVRQK